MKNKKVILILAIIFSLLLIGLVIAGTFTANKTYFEEFFDRTINDGDFSISTTRIDYNRSVLTFNRSIVTDFSNDELSCSVLKEDYCQTNIWTSGGGSSQQQYEENGYFYMTGDGDNSGIYSGLLVSGESIIPITHDFNFSSSNLTSEVYVGSGNAEKTKGNHFQFCFTNNTQVISLESNCNQTTVDSKKCFFNRDSETENLTFGVLVDSTTTKVNSSNLLNSTGVYLKLEKNGSKCLGYTSTTGTDNYVKVGEYDYGDKYWDGGFMLRAGSNYANKGFNYTLDNFTVTQSNDLRGNYYQTNGFTPNLTLHNFTTLNFTADGSDLGNFTFGFTCDNSTWDNMTSGDINIGCPQNGSIFLYNVSILNGEAYYTPILDNITFTFDYVNVTPAQTPSITVSVAEVSDEINISLNYTVDFIDGVESNCFFSVNYSSGADAGINNTDLGTCSNNTTFNVPTAGGDSYVAYVYANNTEGTIGVGTDSFTVGTAPETGGGGATPPADDEEEVIDDTIPPEEYNQDLESAVTGETVTFEQIFESDLASCNIEVDPSSVNIDVNNDLAEISIISDEDQTYSPDVVIVDVEGQTSYRRQLELTNAPGTILPRGTSSFGVRYTGTSEDPGMNQVALISQNCAPIFVDINVNKGPITQITSLFGFEGDIIQGILDKLFEAVFDSLPWLQIWMIVLLVFLLLIWFSRKNLEKMANRGKTLSLFAMIALLAIASYPIAIILVIILRALLGGVL